MGDYLLSWSWILDAFETSDENLSQNKFEELLDARIAAFQQIESPVTGTLNSNKTTEGEEAKLSIYDSSHSISKSQLESVKKISDITGYNEAQVAYVLLVHQYELNTQYFSQLDNDSVLAQEFQRRYYAEIISCWKVLAFLLQACTDADSKWHKMATRLIVSIFQTAQRSGENAQSTTPSIFCVRIIDYLSKMTSQAAPASLTFNGEEAISQWYFFHFNLQLQLLRVIFLSTYSLVVCNSEMAISWFNCMKKTRYLHDQEFMHLDIDTGFSMCKEITNVAIIISINFISLEKQVLSFKDNPSFFMLSGNTIISLHDMITQLSNDSIGAAVSLTWGIALHLLSNSPDNIPLIQNSSVVSSKILQNPQNSFQALIIAALKYDPFTLIHRIISSLEDDPYIDGYSKIMATLFSSAVSYVKFSDSTMLCATTLFKTPQVYQLFENNDSVTRLLNFARARFPFEYSQFVLLLIPTFACLTSKQLVSSELLHMTTFTQSLPSGFKAYEIIPEPNVTGNALIELQESLHLDSYGFFFPNAERSLPKGTRGRIVSVDTYPPVVMWDLNYSLWEAVGISLNYIVRNGLINSHKSFVLTVLSSSVPLFQTDVSGACELVHLASEGLDGELDFINVICDLLDYFLSLSVIEDADYQICVSSLRLLREFTRFAATDVWAYVTRSLVCVGSEKGISLEDVIFDYESINGVYDFTLAFFDLYEILLDNCISTSVVPDDFSIRLKTDFVKRAMRFLCEVFANYLDWKYARIIQQYQIGHRFASLITKLLNVTFGIEYFNPKTTVNKKTLPLRELSHYIVQRFLVQQDSNRYLHPLLSVMDLINLLYTDIFSTISSPRAKAAKMWLISSFCAMKTLICLRGFLNLKPSELERELFSRSPDLFNCLPRLLCCIAPILQLLSALILAPWPSETPSLLAYMINSTDIVGRVCIQILTNPIQSTNIEGSVWKFLSSIMKGQQQGLAVLLFSGKKFPLDRMKSLNHNVDVQLTSKSLISLAEKRLDSFSINDILSQVPVFEFIFLSRNFWTASLGNLQQEANFWNRIVDAIKLPLTVKLDGLSSVAQADLYILAAHATRITAIQLHMSKLNKSNSSKKIIIDPLKDSMKDLVQHAFTITAYDSNIHNALTRAFKHENGDLHISDLRNTGLFPLRYGDNYFYNIKLAKNMLLNTEDTSFKISMMMSANENLSLLDAQAALLRSWSIFICAFVEFVKEDATLPILELKIMKWVLKSLAEDTIDVNVVQELSAERAALVFRISQQTLAIPISNEVKEHLQSILLLTWKAITTTKFSIYEDSNGEMAYYRPLLHVLYNTLNRLLSEEKENLSLSVGFVSGLLQLCHRKLSQLFEKAVINPTIEVYGDIVLLNSLHKCIVNSHLIRGLQSLYISYINDSFSVDNCLRLFSWSHSLLVDGQPYFADAALSFLLICSSSPAGAEQIVMNGFFYSIMESPLSTALSTGGLGLDGSSIQYKIWIRGILPLLFNIVKFLGNRIMNDMREFVLLAFPQIQYALLNWCQPPSSISLASIDESFMIVLLFDLLQQFNPALLQEIRLAELKIEMLGGIDYLISHPNFLSSLAIPASLYEQEYAIDVIGIPKELESDQLTKETKTSQFAKLIRIQLDKLRALLEH
nr:nucleoporin [Schizosaccharomyces pombe]